MQNCLKQQIGKNVQVYVDDIVIKSKKAETLLDDLKETIAALNAYQIKLAPPEVCLRSPTGRVTRVPPISQGYQG